MVPWCLNTAWMWSCHREARAFKRACHDVEGSQAALLKQIVGANRDTWFGRRYGFDRIIGTAAFQRQVPPARDVDFADPINRIAAGEQNVLTAEPVTILEPTSGTISGEKLIPNTQGLRRQFQRGVAAWISNLFQNRPAVRGGRAYWSISPALSQARRSPGGLPIGFADDASYLGGVEQFFLRRLLAVPGTISRISDLAAFRYATLRFLLAAEDLALISVWNPTFLTILVEALPQHFESLCRDIRRGTLTLPEMDSAAGDLFQGVRFRVDQARAMRLESIWNSGLPLSSRLSQIWPRLSLISCWGDAAAAQFLPELRGQFPGVEIQPKGLLATEGFVSFPLVGQHGAALAVRCHFFEFEEIATGDFRLAHQLEFGGRYRVLLTTAGGLYRYQLRDEIEVVGFHAQAPLLRFLGKSDLVSDLVGEKISEAHVRALLEELPELQKHSPRFALLVPDTGPPPRYRLYIQGPSPVAVAVTELAVTLQEALERNPYYRQAVALGQLAPVEIQVLDPSGEPAWLTYERACLARGQKCGDIKPVALERSSGWPERFAPLLPSSPISERQEHSRPIPAAGR